jgi:Phosphotransferase enzyme family
MMRGVAAWSSAAWREAAVAWMDERLAAAGLERAGEVEQPRVRPWATVLKVPVTGGTLWFKAAGPGTAFEVPLYELLARAVPERVLTPVATDAARGWMLLPDGGPVLGERAVGADLIEGLVAAIVRYGRLQRDLEPHVGAMLALGVPDMRPAAMPERFAEALEAAAIGADAAGRATLRRVAAMEATVAAWCERLAASPGAPSLDHNDLHPWNVLDDGAGGVRYYDWGDSVVAHPFAAMLVPLGFVQYRLEATLEDPRFLRARDAYLDVFADLGPRASLADTLALACHVAKIARALTWDRALQAAREQGEAIDPNWATAPLETVAMVLDESYLGR